METSPAIAPSPRRSLRNIPLQAPVTTGPTTNVKPLLDPIMASKTTLDYYKELLEKISFADRTVFRKELRKAFRRLVPEERAELKRWFRTHCVCRLDQQEMQAVLIALERHDRR